MALPASRPEPTRRCEEAIALAVEGGVGRARSRSPIAAATARRASPARPIVADGGAGRARLRRRQALRREARRRRRRRGGGPEGLPGIVAKWRAIAVLKAAAGEGVVAFEVASGPRTYAKRREAHGGARLGAQALHDAVQPAAERARRVLLPEPRAASATRTGATKPFTLPLQVKDPPFGAEHLIAILSDEPLDELHTALKGLASPDAAVELPAPSQERDRRPVDRHRHRQHLHEQRRVTR